MKDQRSCVLTTIMTAGLVCIGAQESNAQLMDAYCFEEHGWTYNDAGFITPVLASTECADAPEGKQWIDLVSDQGQALYPRMSVLVTIQEDEAFYEGILRSVLAVDMYDRIGLVAFPESDYDTPMYSMSPLVAPSSLPALNGFERWTFTGFEGEWPPEDVQFSVSYGVQPVLPDWPDPTWVDGPGGTYCIFCPGDTGGSSGGTGDASGSGSGGGGGGSSSGGGGGGGTDDGGYTSTPDVYPAGSAAMDGSGGPAGNRVNLAEELSCFNTFNNVTPGWTHQIVLYADTPHPLNSNWPLPASASGVTAGHAFISLVQTAPDGTVMIKTLGFYPQTGVNQNDPIDQGEIRDDSQREFEASATFDVTADDFNDTLLDLTQNPLPMYRLTTSNCVNWAQSVAWQMGVTMPIQPSMFWGLTPQQMGNTIAATPSPANATNVNVQGGLPLESVGCNSPVQEAPGER